MSLITSITASRSFDTERQFSLTQWGSYGTADGQFRYPYGVATDGSGNVFVLEYFNRVQQFDAAGNFIEKWGSVGSGDGQFRYPRGIAVFDGGVCEGSSFFVADAYNYRIQKFSSPGSSHISTEIGKARASLSARRAQQRKARLGVSGKKESFGRHHSFICRLYWQTLAELAGGWRLPFRRSGL